MQSYVEIRLVNIATYLSNIYEFILIDNKSQKTVCLFMPPVPTLSVSYKKYLLKHKRKQRLKHHLYDFIQHWWS